MSITTIATARAAARSQDGTEISYVTLGTGEGVLVLGGALRTGRDYMPFAQALARSHMVHVIDRRGRGGSGPQGERYGIDREVEDLLAVQGQTRAASVFGHSYGGLVALEAARRSSVFSDVIVYEPGVSIGGSLPSSWLPRYRELLAAGDPRGAFATMVKGSGFAPAPLSALPSWCVRVALGLFVRGDDWRRIEAQLRTSLAEQEAVLAMDDGGVERYGAITARVLLLGGRGSPAFITTEIFEQLQRAIPNSTSELIDGLDHTAPDEKAPDTVAEHVRRHLRLGY
jgi:pimeloyl-ACP methyl ester carboxylesterase